VADCGPLDPLDADTIATAALTRAHVVILVAVPTALGVRRLVDEVPRLRAATASPLVVVWNQVRTRRQHGGLGSDPMQRLTALTRSVAPEAMVAGLPWDPRAVSRTVSGTLCDQAPRSDLRQGIARLAAAVLHQERVTPGEMTGASR
jgi:MinD-like ATPase involved in chromosome partitioning or flagellar assembly